MKIERVKFRNWPEAYRCTTGELELVVVASIGPRILSLRHRGGENLLYEDKTSFGVGNWKMYGGHRFTIAPESGRSYFPDNQPCRVLREDDVLQVRSVLCGEIGRDLEIRASRDSEGFCLRNILHNTSKTTWRQAAWSIVCVPATGRVVMPVRRGIEPRFWPDADGKQPHPIRGRIHRTGEHLLISPLAQRGKLGLFSDDNWLAHLRGDTAFVVQGPCPAVGANYPDGNCNAEVFGCADYFELETLGPLVTVKPGGQLVHEELWQVMNVEALLAHRSRTAASTLELSHG